MVRRRSSVPGIQRGSDELVAQPIRGDQPGDPGLAGRPADNPPGGVPVQPPPVPGEEHRSFGPLADGQVDRPGGPRETPEPTAKTVSTSTTGRALTARPVLAAGAGRVARAGELATGAGLP